MSKPSAVTRKLTDMIPDAKNANKHTVRGMSMLEDSLQELGAGRSIVVDRNNNVIAGNATLQAAVDAGFEDAIVVPTDGKQLVVVQRTDLDLDGTRGRKLAIADNRTAEVSLDWDSDVLKQLADDGLDLSRFWDADELAALIGASDEPPGDQSALFSSESEEWYTPAMYIEAARQALGDIDVDPASNEYAQRTVKAATYYTKKTDGFNKDWRGHVWLNPPYGNDSDGSLAGKWAARLIEQYDRGITSAAVLLVNAVTDRKWFQPLYRFPMCFTNHRIRFEAVGDAPDSPTYGSAFIYFGNEPYRFAEVFKQFGVVMATFAPERAEA